MREAPAELFTDRLVGVRVSTADLPSFHAFYGDAEVMRHLDPRGGVWKPDAVEALLDGHVRHWEDHGFGTWVFRDPDSGAFVGRAGLRSREVGGRPEVELFYGLASEWWGRGLATEMAREIVRVAFAELGLGGLVAFTLPTNLRSRRVLEKCGFTATGELMHAGMAHVFFRRAASVPVPVSAPAPRATVRTRRPAKLSGSATPSAGAAGVPKV